MDKYWNIMQVIKYIRGASFSCTSWFW